MQLLSVEPQRHPPWVPDLGCCEEGPAPAAAAPGWACLFEDGPAPAVDGLCEEGPAPDAVCACCCCWRWEDDAGGCGVAACCFTFACGLTGGRAAAPLRAMKRAGAAAAAGADGLALLPLAVFAFPAAAALLLGAWAALLPLAFPFPEWWESRAFLCVQNLPSGTFRNALEK